MEKKVLLGTLVRTSYVPQHILKNIVEDFNTNRIFIFSVDDDIHKRLITFNVEEVNLESRFSDFKDKNRNTLILHRRRDSNTFYTINSLNKLVSHQNGKESLNYKVNWNDYVNSCVLIDNEGQLKVLKTKLAKIIDC